MAYNKVICSNANNCPYKKCEHIVQHDRDINCYNGLCCATEIIVQCIPVKEMNNNGH